MTNFATFESLLRVATKLRNSQGFYSRLYAQLRAMDESDQLEVDRIFFENEVADDDLAIIMFLET